MQSQPLLGKPKETEIFRSPFKTALFAVQTASCSIPSVIIYNLVSDPFYAPAIYSFQTFGLIHNLCFGAISNYVIYNNPPQADKKYIYMLGNGVNLLGLGLNLTMLFYQILDPMVLSDS